MTGDGAEVPSPLSRPPWPKSRLRLAEQTTMHNHRDPFRAPAREPKPGTFISPRMASGYYSRGGGDEVERPDDRRAETRRRTGGITPWHGTHQREAVIGSPNPTAPAMRPGQSPMHRHSRTFGDPVATNGLNGAFGQLPDPPSLFEGADRQNPASAGFCFLGLSPRLLPDARLGADARGRGGRRSPRVAERNDCGRHGAGGLTGGHYRRRWRRR